MSTKQRRPRLLAVLFLIPIIMTSFSAALNVNALDNRLVVSLGPANLIADGADHTCIFVQLTNAKGEPIQAPEDVTVTLTSSRLDVGTVEDTISIPEGSSFGNATFHSTKNPGTALITASAPGYMTDGAEITTFSSSTDSQLKIYLLPSIAPAINGTKGRVAIAILDEFDVPYPSTEDVAITLTTNSSILTVTKEAVIPAGSYYVMVNYTVTGNFTVVGNSTVTAFGNVALSALAQGFKPGSAVVQVKTPGNETRSLSLEIGPSILLPEDSPQDSVVVSLLDKDGNPVVLNGTVIISLSSSADKTVTRVQKSVTIANGTYYAYVNMSSIGRGTSLIAASAQGLTMDTKTITIDGSVPSSLNVYTTPNSVLSGDPLKPIVTVLIVDQNGAPILVDEAVNVFLSSSNIAVGTIARFVTIPKGHYYAQVPVEPESKVGTIDIAASAKGFEPATNRIKTTELTMNATLTATRPTQLNDTILVSVSVDRLGDHVKGVTVEWSVIGGVIVTQNTTTNADGAAATTIKQTSTMMKISAHLTKPGYKDIDLTRASTVPTPQSTELTINILGLTVPLFNLIVGIGVLVIAVFALYIFLKYRKKASDKLEVVG